MKTQTATCLALRPLPMCLLALALLLPLRAPAQPGANATPPPPGVSGESKLQSIILPSLDLHQAKIELVVQLLNMRGVELDPAKQGTPIVLKLNGKTPDQIPPVSFHGKQISLLDSIKAVTLLTDLSYRIDGNMVVLESE